jgi:hypothetical protein
MDLLEEFEVSYPLLVVGYEIFILNTRKSVAVFEVAVGILSESFIFSHLYSGEVVSIAKVIVSRLIVGREESRQGRP